MFETISQIDTNKIRGKSPLEKLEIAYQEYQKRFFNANVVKPFKCGAKKFKRFLHRKKLIHDGKNSLCNMKWVTTRNYKNKDER